LNISQIILGVCVLHHNRVVHFDLKPQNILIDSEGRLKLGYHFFSYKFILLINLFFLADYGESRLFVGDIITMSQRMGTFMYIAPELLDPEKKGYLFLFLFHYLFQQMFI
jgi:serine/threonine protein kinase